MVFQWVKDEVRAVRRGRRGGAGLAPARISQPHSECCRSGRGCAAEPAITEVGAAKAAASGRLPWRAHHQEEHIRLAERTRSYRTLSEEYRGRLLQRGGSARTSPPDGHP